MVDPYAPPADARPDRPAAVSVPSASASDVPTYATTYEMAPDEPTRTRRWRHRRTARSEPRLEPAHPGLFWSIAAIGVGLLGLARLMLFFATSGNVPANQVAAGLFGVIGLVALSVCLACAAVLQRGLATPWRIALLLGAGYFAVVGLGFGFPGAFPL